jgi:hypothetical protein
LGGDLASNSDFIAEIEVRGVRNLDDDDKRKR